ncbi:unnamed protein product [Phytomonas sp. Hart1]|nr:unnamed protein product [Phytomonas sp. Hart1]|eukprot:CCW67852.1 unnamed protein product [Phytomonas sp. isolate Hart1]
MKSAMSRNKAMLAVAALFALVLGYTIQDAAALKMRPTSTSLMLEVGNEEVCIYASNRQRFEGVVMHYQLVQGDIDFDVFIRDSINKTIYASFAGEHETSERIYFTTRTTQQYAFCVDSSRYTTSKQLIKMDIGFTSLKRWKPRLDPLRKLMTVSDGLFLGLHDDQMMMRLREQSLREGLEKTFTMLIVHGVTEILIVVMVSFLNTALMTYLLQQVSL